jgi:hypothetical protein
MTNWTRRVSILAIAAVGFTACDDNDDDTPAGPDAPGAPTVSATAATDDFAVTATWGAVADADDYLVTIEPGGDQQTVTATTATFSGLAPQTEFTISVVARNAGGPSAPGTATATTEEAGPIFFVQSGFNNIIADPGFDASAFSFGTLASPPDFTLAAMPGSYTAASIPTTDVPPSVDGRTIQQTNYAGAVAPGTSLADAWYNGWTVWAADGSDSRRNLGLPVVDVVEVNDDRTFFADTVYRLTASVFVGDDCGPDGPGANQIIGCNPVTLTIEPGTTIIGATEANSRPGTRTPTLIVARGSRLVADATPDAPRGSPRRPTEAETIVFTSEENYLGGPGASGQWGGLVINGNAPSNAGDNVEGEGGSGQYGGNDINNDAGILRGVRVEFAGDTFTEGDELNGIAPQGVGAGTTFSYIQVHYNQDDGIEPFGGAVSIDHLVLTGIGDDSFDATDGWKGFAQFVLIQQNGDDADQGFEISNNGDEEGASPRTTGVVANITAIGGNEGQLPSGSTIAGPESDRLIEYREGTFMRLYNGIFQGFGDGFCITDGQTIANAIARVGGSTDPNQTLSGEGLILFGNGDNNLGC